MPICQYFLRVGGILFVALFAADWWLPAPAAHPNREIPPNERVTLRIRSDHKWPERIVFDTAHSGLAQAVPHHEPDVIPGPELAEMDRREPLNAFAAMEPAPAAPAATNDNASAIPAKPVPGAFRMTGTIKAD